MTRTPYPGASYIDAWPSGECARLYIGSHMQTHLARVALPAGESFGLLFLRCTVAPFRFGGKRHDSGDRSLVQEWTAVAEWLPARDTPTGRGVYVGERFTDTLPDGYQYVTEDGQPVPRWATYGPLNGLSEWCVLGPATVTIDGEHVALTLAPGSLQIGQVHDSLGPPAVALWDGTTHRLIAEGQGTFIVAHHQGEDAAVSWATPTGAWTLLGTMAELRALPPLVTPEPPDPPDPEPPDPEPPDPTPEPPKPEPPHPPPLRLHRKASMDLDGKTVILRGPAGLLAYPDAPNTGTWGSLGDGWRGFRWAGARDTDPRCRHVVHKLPNGRYTLTNKQSNGLAGADATKHSGSIPEQFYYKPDGNTDAGDYEQWRIYDGNESGALEAQIEYTNDEGRYFACPLAVEVVA